MISDTACKRVMVAAVLFAMLAYGIAADSFLISGVAAALGLFAFWLSEGPKGRPLPQPVIYLLVALALLWALGRAIDFELNVNDFSEFVMMLQVIKLFDRKRPRDYAQLVTLSVFLVIGAILTSNSFPFALSMVVFVPLVVVATVFYQFYSGRHRVAYEQSAPPEVAAVWTGSGPRGMEHLRRLLAGGTVAALTFGLLVFLLFPRGIGADAFGQWGRFKVGRATTGFTDSVQLGEPGLITPSQTAVLDLEVQERRDGEWSNVGSPNRIFHLRGAVLDSYDPSRGRWTRGKAMSRSEGQLVGAGQTFSIRPQPPLSGRLGEANVRAIVTIRNAPNESSYLFTLWRPLSISPEQEMRISSSPPDYPEQGPVETRVPSLYRDETFQRVGPGGKVRYSVDAVLPEVRRRTPQSYVRPVPTFPSETVRERAEQVLSDGVPPIPPDPEERRAMADAMLRDADDETDGRGRERWYSLDAQAAWEFANYLRSNFRYTLDLLRAPSGTDPIEWFLEDSREGNCEYFASAMAAMCRSVGINARLVTGYVAADYNAASGHYVVRESNAHAWVEVEIAPGYWKVYDPTPPSDLSRIHQPELSAIARVARFFDALEYAWLAHVVGFDSTTQKRLFNRGAENTAGSVASLSDRAERIRAGGPRLLIRAVVNGLMVFVGATLVGLVAVRLAGRIALRRRRRLRVVGEHARQRREQAELIRSLDDALSRLGHARPAWRPMLAHIDAWRPVDESLRESARGAAELLYQVAFAGRLLTPEQVQAVRSGVRALTGSRTSARPGS